MSQKSHFQKSSILWVVWKKYSSVSRICTSKKFHFESHSEKKDQFFESFFEKNILKKVQVCESLKIKFFEFFVLEREVFESCYKEGFNSSGHFEKNLSYKRSSVLCIVFLGNAQFFESFLFLTKTQKFNSLSHIKKINSLSHAQEISILSVIFFQKVSVLLVTLKKFNSLSYIQRRFNSLSHIGKGFNFFASYKFKFFASYSKKKGFNSLRHFWKKFNSWRHVKKTKKKFQFSESYSRKGSNSVSPSQEKFNSLGHFFEKSSIFWFFLKRVALKNGFNSLSHFFKTEKVQFFESYFSKKSLRHNFWKKFKSASHQKKKVQFFESSFKNINFKSLRQVPFFESY